MKIVDCELDPVQEFSDVYEDDPEETEILDAIPMTNSAYNTVSVLRRDTDFTRQPVHVLLNLAFSTMTRYNKPLRPTLKQKSFIDRIACTLFGVAFPILYFHAMLFPRHFWVCSKFNKETVLGCAPVSSFCSSGTHPYGFASHLERGRNYITHSSSSTATDDLFVAHLYDVMCNVAATNLDSRTVATAGFKVDDKSSSGLKLGDRDESELNDSMDTSKGMMGLAAASNRYQFDGFVTYTCAQNEHPGIRHLYDWKESKQWMSLIPDHKSISDDEVRDTEMSFEMNYSHVLSRCWLEVQRIWIELIMRCTSSMLPRAKYSLFRKEYQEDSGNLSHLHALLSFDRGARTNEEFMNFISELQKNSVVDLMDPDLIEGFKQDGLVHDDRDWCDLEETAYTILSHTCASKRCLVKTGPGENDHYCKKQHPVLGRDDPLQHEWKKIPVKFSQAALNILENTGHYTPPTVPGGEGTFTHQMFDPRRHIGKCNPTARENMSPVIAEHFAATRSMQNFQVVCGTNGVTRYVVKVCPSCESLSL